MELNNQKDLISKQTLLQSRWIITAKICNGGFSEIYEAYDKHYQTKVAVKAESTEQAKCVHQMEISVLKTLQGKDHVCKFIGSGRVKRYTYFVMSLQGPDLANIRHSMKDHHFSLSTSLRLGYQILESIEQIHEAGIIHRDIKPSNFTLGSNTITERKVYMIDFGLSRQFVDNDTFEIRSPRDRTGFRGTARYASIHAHNYYEIGRQDDLISFLYTVIEFVTGRLPWAHIEDKHEIQTVKENTNHHQLIQCLPPEFGLFLNHVEILTFYDDPDYDILFRCFDTFFREQSIKKSDPFDWEIETDTTTTSEG